MLSSPRVKLRIYIWFLTLKICFGLQPVEANGASGALVLIGDTQYELGSRVIAILALDAQLQSYTELYRAIQFYTVLYRATKS